MPQAHSRHHRHLELAELVWTACLEATDVPYALTTNRFGAFDCQSEIPTFVDALRLPPPLERQKLRI